MARSGVFKSNNLLSVEERKSQRVPKIKIEYADYIDNLLSSPKKPERHAKKRALLDKSLKPTQQKKIKLTKEKPVKEKAAKKKPAKQKAVKEKAVKEKPLVKVQIPVKKKSSKGSTVVLNADTAFTLPVPEGFRRTVCQRQRGSSAGKFDTYYYGPDGKCLRSRPDIAKYLANHKIGNLTVENFEFLRQNAKFETILAQPQLSTTEGPASSAQVNLKEASVALENIDHLFLQQPAGTEQLESQHLDTGESPRPESEDEVDLGHLNWRTARIPQRWLPYESPYRLIYEDPAINGSLWKLFASSIIIYYWKFNSFVHKYVFLKYAK